MSATHLVLLPTGKVFVVGEFEEGLTEPRLWDPAGPLAALTPLAKPGFNVFCAGHSALADGRILFAGGHAGESHFGVAWASIFDPFTGGWPTSTGNPLQPSTIPAMNRPRWYPTNTTLPNGEVLVMSGEIDGARVLNTLPQVFKPETGSWRDLTNAVRIIPFYPRNFVAPNGKVFVANDDFQGSFYLDPAGTGSLRFLARRKFTLRRTEYFTGVMYEPGKVLIAGGGGGGELRGDPAGSDPPTGHAEVIDLNATAPAWREVAPMNVRRRQATATVLPDGKVLVLGGSTGGRFDDYRFPAYEGELWDPRTERWTRMASTSGYHGYHSASLLLPDGRVLFGGGTRIYENHPTLDSKVRAVQLYSPPYLFRGPRPELGRAPRFIEPATTFRVEARDTATIDRVTLVRLGAVTHAFDQDQRFIPLTFTRGQGALDVDAPRDNAIAPPGHYMLFALNADGVPSVAKILKVNVASPGGSSDPISDDPAPPPGQPPPGQPPPPDVDPVFPIEPEPKGGAAAGGGGGGCSSAGGFAGALAVGLPLLWWRARRRLA